MEVEIKDRKEEVEYLRMALNMCELGVGYTQTDLILRVLERLDKVKGEFTITDAVEIHHKHKQEWQMYFEEKYKERNKDKEK
jgi:hypothetical protein